ncbi:MAG: hypothetical protein GY906_18110 [bacterium]|nr:hypothetical protein [bacterium]
MAEIELDTTRFIKRLDLADSRVREAVWEAMNDNRLDLEKQAKKLVAKKEGHLEDSSVSTLPQWRAGRNEIESRVGFNESYAAKVHETMKPAIATPQMEPGETTRARPPTEFGNAGGKYLERPLFGKAKKYTKHIAHRVRRMLG